MFRLVTDRLDSKPLLSYLLKKILLLLRYNEQFCFIIYET